MDHEKIGKFILELRKSNQMTQKDLALRLHITDKAVSKWERGLSCPDISLLSPLAELFGVTTGELLNGEKAGTGAIAVEESIDHALQYADHAAKRRTSSIQTVCAMAFTLLLLVGIAASAICDVAITGRFSWSLIPISAIVFAWLVIFPVIRFGERGILGALAALTVFILPFLAVLALLLQPYPLIFPIGSRIAVIALAFVWIILLLFRLLRGRTLLVLAVALLLGGPVNLLIGVTLSKFINEPSVDAWDILTLSLLAVAAVVLFVVDYLRNRRAR